MTACCRLVEPRNGLDFTGSRACPYEARWLVAADETIEPVPVCTIHRNYEIRHAHPLVVIPIQREEKP